jgi:hypothetical protein
MVEIGLRLTSELPHRISLGVARGQLLELAAAMPRLAPPPVCVPVI